MISLLFSGALVIGNVGAELDSVQRTEIQFPPQSSLSSCKERGSRWMECYGNQEAEVRYLQSQQCQVYCKVSYMHYGKREFLRII